MIQDVKLGTHKIGTLCMPSTSVRSCSAFIWKCRYEAILYYNKIIKKLINMGVEMGVATRMAQVMWPMMIVTPTKGLHWAAILKYWQKCEFWAVSAIFTQNPNISKLLPSEALKICRSNYHHRPHHLSHSCGHTPFHTHIN